MPDVFGRDNPCVWMVDELVTRRVKRRTPLTHARSSRRARVVSLHTLSPNVGTHQSNLTAILDRIVRSQLLQHTNDWHMLFIWMRNIVFRCCSGHYCAYRRRWSKSRWNSKGRLRLREAPPICPAKNSQGSGVENVLIPETKTIEGCIRLVQWL